MAETQLEAFVANFEVLTPIETDGNLLVLKGFKAHMAGFEKAILVVSVCDGLVEAGLKHDREITIFSAQLQLSTPLAVFKAETEGK